MKRIFSFGAAAILLAGLLLSLNVPGNPPEATSPNEPSQTEPIDSAALDNSDLLFQQYRAEQIARMPMDSTGALDLQAWAEMPAMIRCLMHWLNNLQSCHIPNHTF